MEERLEETLFLMELTVKKLNCVAELIQPYFTEDVLDLQKVCDRYEHYKMCAHLLIDQVYYLQQYQNELRALALKNPNQEKLAAQIGSTMQLVERGAHLSSTNSVKFAKNRFGSFALHKNI